MSTLRVDNLERTDGTSMDVGNSRLLADLVAITGTDGQQVTTSGRTSIGDGGGGRFYWDAASTEADNGGTIFKATDVTTGRWKRIYSGAVIALWFGTDKTGAVDSGPMIQKAVDYAVSINQPLVFPSGTYLVETPVAMDNFSGLTILGYGAVIDYRVGNTFTFGDVTSDANGYFTQTAQTVSNIIIKGLEFEPQVDTFIPATNRWSYISPIRLSSARNVQIIDCTFRDWDFSAIDLCSPSKEIAVRNCRFISSREAVVNYGFRPFCYVAPLDNYDDATGQLAYAAPTVFHEDITMEGCYSYQVSHSIISWNVHRSLYINNTFEKMGSRGISVTNWNFDSVIYGNKYKVANNTVPTLSTCIRVGVGCQRIRISNEIFSGTVSGTAPNAYLKIIHVGAIGRDNTIKDCIFDIIGADINVLVDQNSAVVISGNRFLHLTARLACIITLGDSTGTGTFDQQPILIEGNYCKAHIRFVSTSYEPIGTIGTITIRDNTCDTLLANRLFASDSVANWIVSASGNVFPLGAFLYEINFGTGVNTFIRVDKLEATMIKITTDAVANVSLNWRDFGGDFW
ncbi:MAG: hypothetical protein PF440_11305, partial [Thiomicrorhabdus sp.]|nr:hypothetical protein [Thiomicrorhabdus sp.]